MENNIITATLEQLFLQDEISSCTEIIFKEGKYILYLNNWRWMQHDLEANMSDDDIFAFQEAIISEKFHWEEKMKKDFYSDFKKQWHVNYSYVYKWLQLRVNWSIGMSKHVMRIRKIFSQVPLSNEIGVPKIIQEQIQDYKWWWLIVVSARPWSWKSTTIASVLQELVLDHTLNVVTLEDPIEYIYDEWKSSIQQRENLFDFDWFSTGVDACMRQTPDIVVVQEMTNHDAIRSVLNLVEKWVMVITTLHTSDTTSIFDAIVGAYPPERKEEILNKLSRLFRCFISQKLIQKSNWDGKIAAFEVLVNSSEIKGYITNDKTSNIFQAMSRKPHISLSKSIFDLIELNEITLEEGLDQCPYTRLNDLKDLLWLS